MQQPTANERGFTLIETIAVLLLMAIITAVLGMAIVQGVKSYVFGRQNVAVSQKAQLALARMERELRAITDIDTTNSDDNCIRFKRETASLYFRSIGLHANSIRMNTAANADAACPGGGAPGDLLLDRVSGFSIDYENEQGNFTADGQPPDELKNLRAIHINLTVKRLDSSRSENFSLIVNPRNNGLLNAPGSSG